MTSQYEHPRKCRRMTSPSLLASESPILPVEIAFHPSWWHKQSGICFDEDFFYHPACRVEAEKKMEDKIYSFLGGYGLGRDHGKELPVIGAVHNAAGYFLSDLLGCEIKYYADSSPQVICAERKNLELDIDNIFAAPAAKKLEKLCCSLKDRYGFLCGDINWSGILNLALDLRGQSIFMDFFDRPDELKAYFKKIATVVEAFTKYIEQKTGTTSISVNRTVHYFSKPVLLHSECSLTMLSNELYEEFLMPFDFAWSTLSPSFGIHYCGSDPHRYVELFAKLPKLDFLDVGWGGDLKAIRTALPNTFLNIRLSPVELISSTPTEIKEVIYKLVRDAGNIELTGICCINMDHQITEAQVIAICEAAKELRKQNQKERYL